MRSLRRWALQLASALSYLHSQKPRIAFRDLSPANVLLTSRNPRTADVKLVNFGLAREIPSSCKLLLQPNGAFNGVEPPPERHPHSHGSVQNRSAVHCEQMLPPIAAAQLVCTLEGLDTRSKPAQAVCSGVCQVQATPACQRAGGPDMMMQWGPSSGCMTLQGHPAVWQKCKGGTWMSILA